jgi:hypothetical protein
MAILQELQHAWAVTALQGELLVLVLALGGTILCKRRPSEYSGLPTVNAMMSMGWGGKVTAGWEDTVRLWEEAVGRDCFPCRFPSHYTRR